MGWLRSKPDPEQIERARHQATVNPYDGGKRSFAWRFTQEALDISNRL